MWEAWLQGHIKGRGAFKICVGGHCYQAVAAWLVDEGARQVFGGATGHRLNFATTTFTEVRCWL